MFDIGASELLIIVIVAVLVIGPKDMPLAMRTAGRWIGKLRKISGHFRSGIDAMVREAEMEEMEKKWKAQNEKIMREHPEGVVEMEPTGALPAPRPAADPPAGKVEVAPPEPAGAEARSVPVEAEPKAASKATPKADAAKDDGEASA